MASRRPRIFVSITSTDLSACRQIVVNALLEMGCTPTGSDTQPPDAGSARAQLRKIIADCDAVLHIAGECSGGDPQTRTPGTPRRSYAQLEYETARELKKPLHVIVCSTKFPYDAHKPEAQDVQALQQAHRQRLLAENPLLATVHKPAELGARVLALKGEFTGSTTAEKSASGDAVLWIGATLSGLLLLGAGVGVLLMETGEQENRRALEKERFQTREATKQQRKKQELQNAQFREDLSALFKDYVARDIPGLTDDARRERAIRAFSKRQNIQPEKVKEIIAWYAGVIKGNPNAGELDLSFATFAEKRFAESAESAGKAIRQFRLELDIADKWREQGRGAEADELRQSVLNNLFLAFRQQAVALIAGGQFKQAADACRLALQETPGEDSDWKRTELHILLGEAALEQAAQTADKAESAAPLQDAAQSFKNALPGSPRDVSARQWAIVQNKQAAALNALAAVSAPGERARLAGSAERVCRNVLEAQIRTTLRREWAAASHNLGAALSGRAAAVDGDRARLLDEAVQAFRNALEVRTRKDLPLEWAQTQSEIAAALHDQASLASDAQERVRLFSGAVQSYNNALEINTLKSAPEKWMNGQYNLAVALRDLALASAPEERARILGESVRAYEKTLNHSRQTAPAEWAQTQYNIAIVLSYQAESGKKEDRARRLGEAAAAYREALKVHTPKDAPQEHSATQYNLAFVLRAQALASTGDERVRLRGEAVQAVRESVKGVENPKPLYLVLSQFLGGYSYELLFAKKPQEAIDAATEALELAPEEIWAATNLTEGLLLSGQYEKAEALCRKNARVLLEGNKSFVESVFADLDALHAAGVTHPDVEKFKKQLSPLLTPPDKTFSGLLPEEQSTQLPLSL